MLSVVVPYRNEEMLAFTVQRLHETIRPGDLVSHNEPAGNLARLGGDEFTILIPDLERVEDALTVAQRVKEAMRRPFMIEGHEIFVTASIGISLFPEDGDDCNSQGHEHAPQLNREDSHGLLLQWLSRTCQ